VVLTEYTDVAVLASARPQPAWLGLSVSMADRERDFETFGFVG
jgi:hypothetical protein